MKGGINTAIVVDVYGHTDNVETFTPIVRDLVGKRVDAETKSRHFLYYLTDHVAGNIPECLPGNGNVITESVAGSGRLEAFYRCKQRFDNEEVTEVCVVCCRPCEEYWNSVCDTLLTPLHSSTVQTAPCSVIAHMDAAKVSSAVTELMMNLPSQGELTVLRTSLIPCSIFNHGYTTRTGGVTTIPSLFSLNLLYTIKKRDSKQAVSENVRRLGEAAGFDPERFHITRTNHGNNVWVLGSDRPDNYDAIITDEAGATVAAAGADCTPLIFADPVKKVCGAAHAGYRGTLLRVAVKTLQALQETYGSNPQDILVTLGPTVCQNCFTFDINDPAVDQFTEIDPSTIGYTGKGDKKRATCDLVTANRVLLEQARVDPAHIDTSRATCTSCDKSRFFSYERDGFPFGNQVGFISIVP